jgi:hypothetical protein
VIASHHQYGFLIDRRFERLLNAAQPFRYLVQSPQSPGGHHQPGGSFLCFLDPLLLNRLDFFNNFL